MQSDPRFAAAAGCLATALGDEVIILSLESGVYFGLDPVGAAVWSRLAAEPTLDELVAAVEAEFDTAGHDVRADVRQLLTTLVSHGLVAPLRAAAAAA